MKTADRTLMVFEAFAELRRPATMSEISRHLEIPVSSCHGLLRALEERGYMHAFEPRGTYFPTRRLITVATAIDESDLLTARVTTALRALRDECGESVVFAKQRGSQVLYLDVIESNNPVRYVASPGETRLFHASSNGHALMSLMPPDERRKLLKRLDYKRLTGRTKLTQGAVEAAVRLGQERGWFANFGESDEDLYAIARPVVIGGNAFSISVVGPGMRVEKNQKRLVAALERTGQALEDAPKD